MPEPLEPPTAHEQQKNIEAYILSEARRAGVPIPIGEKRGIEPAPDFVFDHENLGIELTELLRPADGRFTPAAEESFHKQLIKMAQAEYYSVTGAKPARVITYFTRTQVKKHDQKAMARTLAEFVRTNVGDANPVVNFSPMKTPAGFGAMSITAEKVDWWSGESGSPPPLFQITNLLGYRISEKDKRLAAYRANLPEGAHVWLLVYCLGSVSRNIPMPHDAEQWQFPFGFERVFWFDSLERRITEIRRQPVPQQIRP